MIIAFDTLKFARRLKQAGLPQAQAEAMAEAQVEAFAEALDTQLATKIDITKLQEVTQADTNKLQRGHDHLQAQINLIKWMLGFNLAFTVAITWKTFLQ